MRGRRPSRAALTASPGPAAAAAPGDPRGGRCRSRARWRRRTPGCPRRPRPRGDVDLPAHRRTPVVSRPPYRLVVEGTTDTPAPRVRTHAHLEVGHVPVVLDGAAELGAADHAIAVERQPVGAPVVGARLQHGVRSVGQGRRSGSDRSARIAACSVSQKARSAASSLRVHLLDPDHADTLPGPAGPGNGITSTVRRCHARPMEDEEFTPLPEDWSRALAIVAHPDDMEFGAAAAVARWTGQGKTITYCMVTSGEAGIDGLEPEECRRVREAEQISSREHRRRGRRGVPRLPGRRRRVRRTAASGDRQDRPQPPPRHRDHRQLPRHLGRAQPQPGRPHRRGRAVIDGVRDAGNRWIFHDQLTDGLEPWGGVQAVWAFGSPEARHVVDTTDTFDAGVESLKAHQAYIDGLGWENFDPREMLEGFGRQAGQRLGWPSRRRSRCSRWAGANSGPAETGPGSGRRCESLRVACRGSGWISVPRRPKAGVLTARVALGRVPTGASQVIASRRHHGPGIKPLPVSYRRL